MIVHAHPLLQGPLRPGWQLSTVDAIKASEKHSCVAGPFGSSISSKFFVEAGVPIIRGSNLSMSLDRFICKDFAFISKDTADKFTAQTVSANDLVFTCWGTIGQVGIIPANGPFKSYVISNKQLKLRVNCKIVDPLYAYYFFACPETVQYIRDRAIGSAVPGINLGILKALPVLVPPPEEQRRIISILGAYDDLIEVNRQRVALLEDMARGLFEEWFVRFRFPGHEAVAIVDTADGPLPEGWAWKTIGDVTSYVNRGLAPKYDETSSSLVINQKCIRDQRLSFQHARKQSKAVPADKVLRPGDILINSTGVGTLGRVAQAEEVSEGLTVDSHVTIVRPLFEADRDFLGMQLLRLQPLFEDMGTGATGQTELSRSAVSALSITWPTQKFREAFGKQARPIRTLVSTLMDANARLAASRDLLLPRLISGQLSVADAERELQEAA
ncbi:restriction endonuclease subunit S [Methylobacterium sp. 37f]|uniref:restriction endonuclease subunit S n=1 Tax=Methylobacterium sp. 37f TaxID=2817058 RepID=UPI001FFD4FCC|nr:restriction endonuclease subunit S [Methylobacterium sp. 37f]MCK2056980.1 restriction endonuclease subunit S [Methylobacterium sp. 37f]